jgi:hypothetical protein
MTAKNLLSILFFCIPITLAAQSESDTPLKEEYALFSVWSQRLDMSQYIGKKYRLTMAIRAEPSNKNARAGGFIRNEYPKGGLQAWVFMDNMSDRPVRKSNWKTYTLESTVNPLAPWLGFGMLSERSGTFYYDDLKLSVETTSGSWTSIPIPNGDFEAENLDPWQQTAFGLPARVLGAKAMLDNRKPFEGKQCLRVENKFLE